MIVFKVYMRLNQGFIIFKLYKTRNLIDNSCVALVTLFKSQDPRLYEIKVKGDLIPSHQPGSKSCKNRI